MSLAKAQARRERRALAERTLDALENGIAQGDKLALGGGVAGDEGEAERKRVAVLLFKASKAIAADADRKEPLFGLGNLRGRARKLGAEAERLARLLARTFTEWPREASTRGQLNGKLLSHTSEEDES
jgi:hypothetical protein